jgi:hypothetical protein
VRPSATTSLHWDQVQELVAFELAVAVPSEHEQLVGDLQAVDIATLERLALAINIEIDRRKKAEDAR